MIEPTNDPKKPAGTRPKWAKPEKGPLDRPQRTIKWDTGVLPGNDPVSGEDYYYAAAQEGNDLVNLGKYYTYEEAQKAYDDYIAYMERHAEEFGLK